MDSPINNDFRQSDFSILDNKLKLAIKIYKRYILHLLKLNELSRCLLIKYENLIVQPGEEINGVLKHLEIDVSAVKHSSFSSYIKQEYVGEDIDKRLDEKLWQLFDADQRHFIVHECLSIFREFYAEPLVDK